MTLPQRARVEATPNFLAGLEAARQFFFEQDGETAEARMNRLKAKLREMVAILAWSPGCGRPARFMTPRSAQAKVRLAAIRELARQSGLPELREYVIDPHIVLYAHSDREVVLLAIKHQRQLIYTPAE
ncbi:MAG: type II toxin-antitoxin system RelE/ParE family toxin [Rhodocyclaceae bacterium]|nr:type II toxin-antitoxin system RelE/ParE family toxin [Rhodocyclaceae bacterium]